MPEAGHQDYSVIVHRKDAEGISTFTWQAEGSGTSGRGRDDSQVKTPAFGKVIALIVRKRQANERNYFTSHFLRIGIYPVKFISMTAERISLGSPDS